jgi:hypothetical protein
MKFSQLPEVVLMVRPASLGFNPETADSNAFQSDVTESLPEVQPRALEEFDRMVDLLASHDIDVRVWEDTATPPKPDAVFPNNWFSVHPTGELVLYPMMAPNRRTERRKDLIDWLQQEFPITRVMDLSAEESHDKFLEGTGSLVIDYPHAYAYACSSPRSNESLFREVCRQLGLKGVYFRAVDQEGKPVYHTNVIMAIGEKFAVVCLDAIRDVDDQDRVLDALAESNKQVVAISYDQMRSYAGNMLEVKSRSGEPYVVLSEKAFHSLLPGQIHAISRHAEMIPVPIPTIETVGGGSVRCMMAGIFLPSRNR